MVAAAPWTSFVLRVEREKQNREEGKKLLGEGGEGRGRGRGPVIMVGLLSRRGARLPSVFSNTECACGLLNACTAVH